jgi:hypothetical protein
MAMISKAFVLTHVVPALGTLQLQPAALESHSPRKRTLKLATPCTSQQPGTLPRPADRSAPLHMHSVESGKLAKVAIVLRLRHGKLETAPRGRTVHRSMHIYMYVHER